MIPQGYTYSENLTKSFRWIFSCFTFLWNGFYNRIIDPILFWITGKNQVIRTLCNSSHSTKMTTTIRHLIFEKTEFIHTREILKKHEKYDMDYAMQTFMEEAGIKKESKYFTEDFKSNIFDCFRQLLGANIAMTVVDSLVAEKYDRTNEDHEALLMQLWNNLRKNEKLTDRDSFQWEDIGFQGKDPATDFRGLGVLSLSNLVYFSIHYNNEAVLCLRNNDVTRGGYPMAITGIQLSSIINEWLEKRFLDQQFYSVAVSETEMTLEERALYFYQEFFCRLFIAFNGFYESKHPENLLQFPIILSEFKGKMLNEINEGIF